MRTGYYGCDMLSDVIIQVCLSYVGGDSKHWLFDAYFFKNHLSKTVCWKEQYVKGVFLFYECYM